MDSQAPIQPNQQAVYAKKSKPRPASDDGHYNKGKERSAVLAITKEADRVCHDHSDLNMVIHDFPAVDDSNVRRDHLLEVPGPFNITIP